MLSLCISKQDRGSKMSINPGLICETPLLMLKAVIRQSCAFLESFDYPWQVLKTVLYPLSRRCSQNRAESVLNCRLHLRGKDTSIWEHLGEELSCGISNSSSQLMLLESSGVNGVRFSRAFFKSSRLLGWCVFAFKCMWDLWAFHEYWLLILSPKSIFDFLFFEHCR